MSDNVAERMQIGSCNVGVVSMQCPWTEQCNNNRCFWKQRDCLGRCVWVTFGEEGKRQDKICKRLKEEYGEVYFPEWKVSVGTNDLRLRCEDFKGD